MQVDRLKRWLAHQLNTEHHHARHPEEEDVVTRLHDLRRVVAFQIARLIWPTERAKRPEARAEPGVKDVALLHQALGERATLAATAWTFNCGTYGDVAVGAVPGGDAMPPPELATHVPIANLSKPVLPRLLKVRRDNARLP